MKKPTAQQIFLVLSMFFGTTKEEREPKISASRVKALSPVHLRNDLVDANVLRIEKRDGRGYIVLGEEAEEFVMKNLGALLPATKSAAPVLRNVLERVREFLQTEGHSLADFTGQEAEARRSHQAPTKATDDAEEAVREAYLGLTQGEKRRRIRLADLRRQVSVLPEVLNHALLNMQAAGQIVLYKMDNGADISADDEQAALYIANEPRHLVYLVEG
jgi:hypothetical protein